MTLRIYYEDTDAGGIVYHANYLKFCERARSEIFFQQGMMPTEDEESGFVVKHIEADFKGSAKLGDALHVQTKVISLKRSSALLLQEVFKEEQILFSMKVQLVYMAKGRISRIPEKFIPLFTPLLISD